MPGSRVTLMLHPRTRLAIGLTCRTAPVPETTDSAPIQTLQSLRYMTLQLFNIMNSYKVCSPYALKKLLTDVIFSTKWIKGKTSFA